MEKYLLNVNNPAKFQLLKFIMRNHLLPVTYNRFEKENIYDMVCSLCDLHVVGDEAHYLFKCSYFDSERKQMMPLDLQEMYCTNPTVAIQSFVSLEEKYHIMIAKFVRIIMLFFKNAKDQKKNIIVD